MILFALRVAQMSAQMLTNQQRLRTQKRILADLDAIAGQLKTLDAKLDEQVLRDARTAAQHLERALSSDIVTVQGEELRLARSKFAELIDLDAKQVTVGTSGEMNNAALICLGYWGSFQYFLLNEDYRNAAIQVYEATARCPDQALLTFADCYAAFFSQDYHALMAEPIAHLYAAKQHLQSAKQENRNEKISGAVMLGVTAAAAIFTGGIGGLLVGAVGAGHINDMFHTKDTATIEKEIAELTGTLDAQRAALVEEAEQRKAKVEKMKPSQMLPRAAKTRKVEMDDAPAQKSAAALELETPAKPSARKKPNSLAPEFSADKPRVPRSRKRVPDPPAD